LLVAWVDQARVAESDLSEYMLEMDPAARERLRAEMAASDAQIAELGAQIYGLDADRIEAEKLATLGQAWRDYAE
jgi:hypothetical protein